MALIVRNHFYPQVFAPVERRRTLLRGFHFSKVISCDDCQPSICCCSSLSLPLFFSLSLPRLIPLISGKPQIGNKTWTNPRRGCCLAKPPSFWIFVSKTWDLGRFSISPSPPRLNHRFSMQSFVLVPSLPFFKPFPRRPARIPRTPEPLVEARRK